MNILAILLNVNFVHKCHPYFFLVAKQAVVNDDKEIITANYEGTKSIYSLSADSCLFFVTCVTFSLQVSCFLHLSADSKYLCTVPKS